jgi:hypothetical protein
MSVHLDWPGEEPTGEDGRPFLLCEGEEKAGKTSNALLLARSPEIGMTFVVEIGESRADAYKRLAPGRYRMMRHDGTYWGIVQQIQAVIDAPRVDGKPNLFVMDSASALWDLEKARVDRRARNSEAARRKLAHDPDAEIKAPFNLWGDAKARWYRIMNMLRHWDGIVVLTARGKEGMVTDGNKIVEDETEWKVQTEGNLKFEVDAWVRFLRPGKKVPARATVVGGASWAFAIPPDGLPLPDGHPSDPNWYGPLHHLIFELMGAGSDGAKKLVTPNVGRGVVQAKQDLVDILAKSHSASAARKVAAELWEKAGHASLPKDAEITDEQWSKLCALAADVIAAATSPEPGLAVVPPDCQPEPVAPSSTPSKAVSDKTDSRRRATTNEVTDLEYALGEAGIRRSEWTSTVGRVVGRTVRDFAALRSAEVHKVLAELTEAARLVG